MLRDPSDAGRPAETRPERFDRGMPGARAASGHPANLEMLRFRRRLPAWLTARSAVRMAGTRRYGKGGSQWPWPA